MTIFGHSKSDVEGAYSCQKGGGSRRKKVFSHEIKELKITLSDGETFKISIFPVTTSMDSKRSVPMLFFGQTETRQIPLALARELYKNKEFLENCTSIEKIKRFVFECEEKVIKKKLLRLVNQRDYSKAEIEKKLLQEHFEPKIIKSLMQRAIAGHLIDDNRYAETYIRNKISRGIGRNKIQEELYKQNIICENLPGWPNEFFDEDEETRALNVTLNKHFKEPNIYKKIVSFLYNKGYSFEVSKEVAARIMRKSEWQI